MSFTDELIFRLQLPSDDDRSHGPQMRQNLKALARAQAPKNCFFVDPDFTEENLFHLGAADRRYFPTIQEAITAAQSDFHGDQPTVYIYPAVYNENLVINGSITLVGKTDPIYEGLGGGPGAKIGGKTTYAGPTIKINPDGVGYTSVNFINLSMENAYNADNSTEITEPYLIDITKPATYDQQACVGMKNCQCRMQTWGLSNQWYSGIRAEGYGRLIMENCNVKAWGYAGGENNGGIRRLFHLRGDSTNGNSFTFYSKYSNFYSRFQGGALLLPHLFDIDDGVIGVVGRSGWDYEEFTNLLMKGATGTNLITGLEGSTIAQYMNTPGVCLSWL